MIDETMPFNFQMFLRYPQNDENQTLFLHVGGGVGGLVFEESAEGNLNISQIHALQPSQGFFHAYKLCYAQWMTLNYVSFTFNFKST